MRTLVEAPALAELRTRCERAVRRARRSGGEVLVGLTVAGSPRRSTRARSCSPRAARASSGSASSSPTAAAPRSPRSAALRRPQADGPGRFAAVAAAWRELAGGAAADAPDGPPGAGLVAVGGFAFAPEGGAAPHWAGFGAGDAGRARGRARPPRRRGPPHAGRARRARRRARGARRAARPRAPPSCATPRCRCSTRRPPGASRSPAIAPPEHYEAAVARAVERIRAGRLREDRARARGRRPRARRRTTPRPSSASCAPAFGSCFVFCAGRGDARVRRRLARAARPPRGAARLDGRAGRLDPPLGRPGGRRPPRRAAAALGEGPRGAGDRRRAGSRARCARTRSGSPRRTSRRSIKVANIQHLATPIRAQLTHPRERDRAGRDAAPDAGGRRRAARRRRRR